ncbi:MarR family transcriptional regulator [Streptomyces sp. SID3343]|uniref:MarR family winged helix-turn-helix transcriptional regulator n=1 Tax=Streptomyces sp. SID3343 TaxID=2690260 RepID=UPI00136F970B|nr:MarR family transcriptional regulator [Streptomyces sp. SID3343]MYW06147.1 MarR family transcriptional regulator [Streptomyces sp. SID3343]
MTERDAIDDVWDQWRRERPDIEAKDLDVMAAVGRMNRLRRHIDQTLRTYFAQYGLDFSEFDVLATLRRSGGVEGVSAGALLRSAMVTSGAITNRVDRLTAKGLVERAAHHEDRRSVLVKLTPEGLRLVDDIMLGHLANEARFLAVLDDDERDQLNGLLRKLLVAQGDTHLG